MTRPSLGRKLPYYTEVVSWGFDVELLGIDSLCAYFNTNKGIVKKPCIQLTRNSPGVDNPQSFELSAAKQRAFERRQMLTYINEDQLNLL